MSKYINGQKIVYANSANYIDFNLTPSESNQEGRLVWDSEDGTLGVGMPGGTVTQQIGQEVVVRAKNDTADDIANGKIVYVSGSSGFKPRISLASNNIYNEASRTIAVSTELISKNQSGYICSFGYVRDVDTSLWVDGTVLYLGTNGNFTNTPPSLDNVIISMGIVIKQHEEEGIIHINIHQLCNKFGDYNSGNYTEIDEGIEMYGTHTRWEDLRVPLTQTKLGASLKPDFDETNIGFLFPQNNTSEVLYTIMQMPHAWKEGSDIELHVHYQQTSSDTPTFKIDYKWFSIGSLVPAGFTTITLDTPRIAYVSGNLHQINENSSVDGTGQTISSLLLIKLYRDDNDVSGDVLTWELDAHYQLDAVGSKEEYVK